MLQNLENPKIGRTLEWVEHWVTYPNILIFETVAGVKCEKILSEFFFYKSYRVASWPGYNLLALILAPII